MFQHKGAEEIEMILNIDFENICDCFVDNKLSIHFSKVKIIQFSSQVNIKWRLDINYKGTEIKHHLQITYLGCGLDGIISGEPMALKSYK